MLPSTLQISHNRKMLAAHLVIFSSSQLGQEEVELVEMALRDSTRSTSTDGLMR